METEKLQRRIKELAEKKGAVIIAHNYMRPEVQDVAHYLGDSLALSKLARDLKENIIIFCGVRFMAETAKILSPEKTVIHPRPDSRCPMANMIWPKALEELKQAHPSAATVAYVNTTAEVKACVDYCCTSGNMAAVIRAVPSKEVIFVPDQNMALFAMRVVKEKKIIGWPGFCPTHHSITKESIMELKRHMLDAPILVHPECRPEVIDVADEVLSTHGMVEYAKSSSAENIILGTEREMCYRLKKENPEKNFFAPMEAVCPNMKKIGLEDILKALEDEEPKVEIAPEIREKALLAIERMVAIGRTPRP